VSEPSNADGLHLLGCTIGRLGRLGAAPKLLRRAVTSAPSVATFHVSLANSLAALGRLSEGAAAYRSALVIEPARLDAVTELGGAYVRLNRDEAGAAFSAALKLDPRRAEAHSNLGVALRSLNRPAESILALRTAICLKPEFPSPYSNLSVVLRAESHLAASARVCRCAMALQPDYAKAHFNLADTLNDMGRRDEAWAPAKLALALLPDLSEAWIFLAILFRNLGRPIDAIGYGRRALALDDAITTKMLLADCLRYPEMSGSPAVPDDLLLRALREDWARPNSFSRSVIQRIAPRLAGLAASMAAMERLAGETLLIELMRIVPIADEALERLLTGCRRILLERVAAADGGNFPMPIRRFAAALAQQCFINEYVFACGDEELALLERIRQAPLGDAALTVVGCYLPLHQLPDPAKLLERSWPEPERPLIRRQIAEPLEEEAIRATIPRLTSIAGEVSTQVREQYEENPYPRWINAGPQQTNQSLTQYLIRGIADAPLKQLPRSNGEILIAGCGTGQHPIGVAQAVPASSVLAIDLSLSSLSYASRKARELGVRNLQFAHADLLELGNIGRSFDLIESVGVLHHLGDPAAGLKVLTSLLRPRGLFRLGLYSERARRSVVAGRALIAELGFGDSPAEIRRFRQHVLALDPSDPLRAVTVALDFASTSECRDLLFHVQEHRTDLREIAEWLDRFGLEFLGFQVRPEVKRKFTERFPAPEAKLDLEAWHLFEEANPDCFAAMYQFWVQKRD